ncbi:hypothetical protein UFOVP80_16 [uncultured Caudovirales phage]|jgi:hypothetical protein|uniref:Uncharacterized protein n=1 Tax=uncultured Caudovirales phage TaxID=2100421 RepID=A0A6J5KZN3_9CAUD|nr:hypothetical protein UFOVP80_16 [uncultured Caudovirales phage]
MSMSAPTGLAAGRRDTGSLLRSPSTSSGSKAPAGYQRFSQFSPEMMKLFEQLLGGVQGGVGGGLDYLSGLASGDEESFKALEAPAYRNFEGALGNIANRFGGYGAIGSSAFQNATSNEATNFAEGLQKQRLGLRQNAIDQLLNNSQQLLNKEPYGYQQKKGGLDTAGDIVSIISKILPFFI